MVQWKTAATNADRNSIPTKQVLHGQRHSATARFQLLSNVVKRLAGFSVQVLRLKTGVTALPNQSPNIFDRSRVPTDVWVSHNHHLPSVHSNHQRLRLI